METGGQIGLPLLAKNGWMPTPKIGVVKNKVTKGLGTTGWVILRKEVSHGKSLEREKKRDVTRAVFKFIGTAIKRDC